ncbi:hypothetical protein M378DRAFT_164671 [Amanita muscaria Koide BX008]|uniref:Uncharacterized protein n=1 Tax=Amanita muscaria (strain Koide BX008) TaxID=946122 RepID=A0A0C2T9K3_AMAMK|nr:hypothetical protein M378DRAFT_164671 [Amanita muscaria Koide BX008]
MHPSVSLQLAPISFFGLHRNRNRVSSYQAPRHPYLQLCRSLSCSRRLVTSPALGSDDGHMSTIGPRFSRTDD